MIYTALFDRINPKQIVRAGVIGTGHFATAIVTQSQAMSRLSVPIVADIDLKAARRAYQQAGMVDDDIVICESRAAALQALDQHKAIIVPDAMLLMDLPLDVIVEATGVPEAGAKHGLAAIEYGKHIVMVNKETDVTVGPMLKQLADKAGVVYTQVDGDQHGMLIGLIHWTQELGLEVLCAGKARDGEYVYDLEAGTVNQQETSIPLSQTDRSIVQPLSTAKNRLEQVQARQTLFAPLPQIGGFDLVEMAIVSNATGLLPDVETLHCPALQVAEIPDMLCPTEMGGMLGKRGVIDAVTCLRQPREAGLVGGVFVVVACHNDYSRHIITSKGATPNKDNTTALIQLPFHLCGVQTPISILAAALLNVSTGATILQPQVDVIMEAKVDLAAGSILGNDHSPDLHPLIRPAQTVQGRAPLPIHLGNGQQLAVDVPAGTLITADMIVSPTDSTLWMLRQQQDRHFSEMLFTRRS